MRNSTTFWLLAISAVIIAVAVYGGIWMFRGETVIALIIQMVFSGAGIVVLVISGALAYGLARVSWGAGKNIFLKEHKPVEGFFYGTALYLFLIFVITEGVMLFLGFAARGAGQAGFVFGLIFSSVLSASIPALYVGLLATMAQILRAIRLVPSEPPQLPSLRKRVLRYGVIVLTFATSLYVFGAFAPFGPLLRQAWICNLVYSSRAQAECFLDVAGDTKDTGLFTTTELPYDKIKDLTDISGKLAYAFENDDNTSGVVYDGEVVSSAYDKVGILPIAEVGGKLAYEAYKNDRQIIVWDGKEYGAECLMALQPTDVAGTLAFLCQQGTGDASKQIVVWNGEQYGTEYKRTNDIREIEGQLAFHGHDPIGWGYIVVGDKKYGPYDRVWWLQERDGHWVAEVNKGRDSFYVVDGVLVGSGYKSLSGLYTFVDDKFAFSAPKDERYVIVYDGNELGITPSSQGGPFTINGKLAYLSSNSDGTTQLVVDGQRTGPAIPGQIGTVAVSKGGRIAVEAAQSNGEEIFYLDGKEIYRGKGGPPFGFYGEKLVFWIEEHGESMWWFEGTKIGRGFYGFNYFALVNGKLVIGAFASTNEGIKYYLYEEK